MTPDTVMEAYWAWRCQTCGKWSHAQRKPARHKRWVRDWTKPIDDMQGGTVGYDGNFVDCGPFDTYLAIRDVSGGAS